MNIKNSVERRVAQIKALLTESGAKGVVYGNSGGKDCTLVGALCKLATDNVLGVIMPCDSSVNYGSDREDALAAGELFGIPQTEADITQTKRALVEAIEDNLSGEYASEPSVKSALININPRLRMTVLYTIAQAKGYLVAGTGNLDEYMMGYFTKWGDGAYDFNPIADLTVAEVYEHLRYLGAPESIINKAPSAGLFPGQTDEEELGVKYADVDAYLKGKEVSEAARAKIENAIARTEHKRKPPLKFGLD